MYTNASLQCVPTRTGGSGRCTGARENIAPVSRAWSCCVQRETKGVAGESLLLFLLSFTRSFIFSLYVFSSFVSVCPLFLFPLSSVFLTTILFLSLVFLSVNIPIQFSFSLYLFSFLPVCHHSCFLSFNIFYAYFSCFRFSMILDIRFFIHIYF